MAPSEPLLNTRVLVAEIYHTVLQKYGSKKISDISSRLKHYYPLYFSATSINRLNCSEEKERQNWESLVSDVFNDIKNIEHLFSKLWLYYSQPSNWFILAENYQYLQELHRKNIAIANNFDRRLNLIANKLIPEVDDENKFTSSR